MKVDVERLEKSTVALSVEVDAAKVEEAISKAYRRLAGSTNVPGFRRGKAPRNILERHVGKPRLLDEAFKVAFPGAYREAVNEAGVEPVDDPEVEDFDIDEGKPLTFKVRVAVKPEVELGDYKAVKQLREDVAVTPEEVEAEIARLREGQAQLVVEESREVKADSFVVVDFQGYAGGEELPNSKATDLTIIMGSGFFLPGFEDQLKGAKTGETREVKVTLPEDHKDKELAGKEVVFKVLVKDIKRKELPPVDDEFARAQGSYSSVQELKDAITNRLTQVKQQRARTIHEESVLKEVVDQCKVEVPEVMTNRRAQSLLEDLLARLERSKITFREYLEGSGQTEDSVKDQLLQAAERKVKTELVLEAIAAKEGIKAEEAEVRKMVDGLAASTKQDGAKLFESLTQSGAIQGFATAITNDKTIAFLADTAHRNAGGKETPGDPAQAARASSTV
ncbi:MAG: trigger factor [Ignavibacteriales bacterium]